MTKQEFWKRCEEGIFLLDGATGSNLLKAGLPRGVCQEQWILDHPDPLLSLQRAYVEAGSSVIYAPTFQSNRLGLARYGLSEKVDVLNKALVQISKKAAAGRALVAGDLTTTGKLMEPMGELSYETLFDTYREQIVSLVEAGVDLLVAETMMAADETLVILDAAADVCDLPVLCSLTMESDGSLFFGGTIYDAVEMLEAAGAAAVGCNCSVGPDQLEAVIHGIRERVSIPVIAKPNAGMPVITATGEAVYSMDASAFAIAMSHLHAAGACVLGGCCGTDPAYIRALKKELGLF